jgi:hypothetical protein
LNSRARILLMRRILIKARKGSLLEIFLLKNLERSKKSNFQEFLQI